MGENIKTEMKTANVLNGFFSNIVEILKLSICDPQVNNIENPTIRAILFY